MSIEIKGRLCLEYLTKFPDTPTATLARTIYKAHKELFTNVETVRTLLRYYRGSLGDKQRAKVTRSGNIQPFTPSLSPFERIPEGLQSYSDWSTYEVEGKSILMLSDLHSPYHDSEALKLALEYGLDKEVDTVLFNGDTIDFFALSFWDKDPRDRDFQNELDTFQSILSIVNEAYPKSKIVIKIGNHEERLERYLKVKAPELLGYNFLSYERLIDPEDKYGIDVIKDKRIIRIGKLNVVHGHEFGKGLFSPVNPARGLYLRGQEIAICGHYHRTSQHTETSMTGNIVSCWSTGCLCYSSDTEVLTNSGWKFFKQLSKKDSVAEYDVESGEISYKKPKAFQQFPYRGKLANFVGGRIDLLVTPEHKMLYSRSTSKLKINTAEYVSNITKPHIPTSGNFKSSDSLPLNESKLIAWIVSEGSVEKDGNMYRVSIYQKKEKPRKQLEKLLNDMDYIYTSTIDKRTGCYRYRLNSRYSKKILEVMDFKPKTLPRKLLNSDISILKEVYEVLIITDGHRKKNNTDYFATIYDKLAGQFQELCTKIGYSCILKRRVVDTNFKKNAYIVLCLVRKFKQAEVSKINIVPYDGTVYDLTTHSGFFIVRRNEKVSISGNCDLHPDYLPINKWNHGFAHIRNDNKDFHVDNRKIIKGKVY